MRIAIAGVPRSGKTTMAEELREVGPDPIHTDDYIDMGWSEASALVATYFSTDPVTTPNMIVEGMAVPRALRKWLKRNPEGRPVDKFLWLSRAHEEGPPGHAAMGKGAQTVMDGIMSDLMARGVEIEVR